MADAKHCTVDELTGTRRRYSKVTIPEKLKDLLGDDPIVIEHFDEGVSINEIPYWHAFFQIKREESKTVGR